MPGLSGPFGLACCRTNDACGDPWLFHTSEFLPMDSSCGGQLTGRSEAREDVEGMFRALEAEFGRLRRENQALAKELEQSRSLHSKWSSLRSAELQHARPADDPYMGSQERPRGEVKLRDPQEEAIEEDEDKAMMASVIARVPHPHRSLSVEDQGCGQGEDGGCVGTSHSLPSATEDHYEKLYDLTRAFHLLCATHKATVGDHELVIMKANQAGCDELDPSVIGLRRRYAKAIRALNKELGVMVCIQSVVQPAREISLDTFIAIVQRRELKTADFLADADDDVLEAISEIRDILVREDALRKIAKATNMSHREIYQASKQRLRPTRMERLLAYLDPIIGLVIILNAAVIGVSTDYEQDSDVWKVCEIIFTTIFIGEIAIKLITQGVGGFCCGSEMCWNLFDALVAVIAIFDLVFTLLGAMTNLRNFTIIRLLRFARLTKLVRVLKLKVFKELALLINGILAGFRTLVWAIVFLGFLLFALGVMLTQMVGQTEEVEWDDRCADVGPDYAGSCMRSAEHLMVNRKELFGNVSRSMFTVFRCFTDGCSSVDGTPLIPYFYNTVGHLAVIVYSIVTLFVIFGLFNLIMAVFVENTIENARHDDGRRREAKETEALRVAKKLQEIIVLFCTGGGGEGDDAEEELPEIARPKAKAKMWSMWNLFSTGNGGQDFGSFDGESSALMSNLSLQVTHAAFTKIMQKPEVQELLDDLDIGVNSRQTLFEVLDANGNGTLEVSELVSGLLKLRGTADKGDLVAALLAIKSVQKSMKAIELLNLHQQEVIDVIKHNQETMQMTLQALPDRDRAPSVSDQGSNAGSVTQERQTPGLSAMRADHERRAERRSKRVSTG